MSKEKEKLQYQIDLAREYGSKAMEKDAQEKLAKLVTKIKKQRTIEEIKKANKKG